MKLSLVFALFASAALVGCASESAKPPRTATVRNTQALTVTSAEVPQFHPAVTGDPNVLANNERPQKLASLDEWQALYPSAASELHDWMQHYPDAAAKLADWGNRHPDRMQTIIAWSMTHPYESPRVLLFDRAGWSDFQDIMEQHPQAVNEFFHWAQRSGPASRQLARFDGGLAWARDNVTMPATHVPNAPESVSPELTGAVAEARPSEAKPAAAKPAAKPAGAPARSNGKAEPTDMTKWYPTPTSVVR